LLLFLDFSSLLRI